MLLELATQVISSESSEGRTASRPPFIGAKPKLMLAALNRSRTDGRPDGVRKPVSPDCCDAVSELQLPPKSGGMHLTTPGGQSRIGTYISCETPDFRMLGSASMFRQP